MAKNTGIPYELLTQTIFNLILNDKHADTIKVDHDVELQGLREKYKVDIYWEFKVGGIEYKTIVQAKDGAKPVKKEQLLTFKGVLDNIPGQPRGVFVTQTGYQSGARNFAQKKWDNSLRTA
jgi:hypothetical protein